MKRALFVSIISVLLIMAVFGSTILDMSMAYHTDLQAKVEIDSPVQNRVYYSSNIPVSFKVISPRTDYWQITSVHITVFLNGSVVAREKISAQTYVLTYSLRLDLWWGEGDYILFVAAEDISYHSTHPEWPVSDFTGSSGSSEVVGFSVAAVAPMIEILSVEQQQVFDGSSVPLDFVVSEPVSWMGYSLDGGDNTAVSGNTTLSGLGGGEHSVVVYATDAYGQTRGSLVRHFSVVLNSAGSGLAVPYWWLVELIVVASAAAVSFALVAYFLRRKKRRDAA